MCGILGSININVKAESLNLIKHRGPDSSGLQLFRVNNNSISLLHCRLSIVDLSEAGNQPMSSFNNKGCIIFNGEIYNHVDLRQRLNSCQFKGHSDTETMVNYFEKFEISENLKDLNGIFAFAYLDLEHELIFLARDRFGVKPLYYYYNNDILLFCSEIRALQAILHSQVNKGALANSLRMRFIASPSTIYQHIHKVEPGQLLTFSLKKNIGLKKSYFVAPPKSLGTKKGDYKKLINEYGDLFEKAVERQLMSDVEVGILLSGGVDSALVAAISKQKSNTAVKAFTIGFEGSPQNIDEIDYAAKTAQTLSLEHHIEKITFPDFLNTLEQIAEIVEEPIATTSIIPMFHLSKLAASKVKVVLSGQGADEPLAGYKKYQGLPWLQYSRPFRSLMPITKIAEFLYNKNEKLRRLVSSMQCADNLDSFIEFNAISSATEANDLIAPSNRTIYTEALQKEKEIFKQIWRERTPKSNISNLFLYYDLRTSLSDDLLMYTDKITMHFSLECRVPILDNDLISFIESLDIRYKYNARKGKIIHKDFAKEYLPTAIIDRKKLGFKSPTESWFRENKSAIENLLTTNKAFTACFNIAAVKKTLDDHSNGQNLEKQIFLLLSLSYLLKKNSSFLMS